MSVQVMMADHSHVQAFALGLDRCNFGFHPCLRAELLNNSDHIMSASEACQCGTVQWRGCSENVRTSQLENRLQEPIMLKRLLPIVLIVLLGVAATAAAQTKRIAVAYSAVSATQSSFFVTKDAGIFEKHGLSVDPVYVASGTKVAQAVIAGEFPVALAGGTVVNATLAGGDIVIIGGLVNVPSFYVYVHSSIKRPEDLKGKAIGITTYGSSTDFSIRYLIKK